MTHSRVRDFRRLADELREHESERLRGVRIEAVVQDPARGRVWTIPEGVTLHVGRHRQAELRVRQPDVSRKHAALACSPAGLTVTNLSPRGTWLDGRRLEAPAVAAAGAELRLGAEARLRVIGRIDPRKPAHVERGLLHVPQRLAQRFLAVRLVGRGAAGAVYEAWDEHQRARCAIKLLSAGGWAAPELVERFRREVALQATLRDYPGIVSMFELGTLPETGELFAVMEYVAGRSLAERLPELSRVEGVRVLARVARAAAFAHGKGLVHRDLKPGNVMLLADDSARLTDFGVSKTLEAGDGLTATGTALGTPAYMAPEQVDDSKRVGPAADVYALGVMLYEHLTGQRPFTVADGDVGELLDRVSAGAFEPPRAVAPRTPAKLEAICLAAMAREPEARPAALELARQLEAWARRIDPPSRVSLIQP